MHISKKILAIAAASLLGTVLVFPAYAETISGKLETADSDSIDGWVWDQDDFDHIVDVELQITPEGTSEAAKILTVKAHSYREDLHESIKDGWHGFSCPIDWDEIEGDSFSITAYAVTEESRTQIPETITYKKLQIVEPMPEAGNTTDTVSSDAPIAETEVPVTETTSTASKEEIGPGVSSLSKSSAAGKKGKSLGIFTTTGYCNCSQCSNGHDTTYSGTTPQANHTISADLDVLPLGTRVMIGDTIYTVEDKGTSVTGNKIDVFYANHEDAWSHGIKEEEVFLVE